MYGRFVGLDVGTDNVKVTLIKRGLRGTDILQSLKFSSSGSLQKVFNEFALPRSDISMSVTGLPVSIKVIKFPFFDARKIDQVIGFELEGVTTFDPQEKIFGYHLAKRDTEGEALVCMFEKENMNNLLDFCEKREINPKVVTYSPIALSSLDGFLTQQRPLLLIDMGSSKTTFSLFDDYGLRRVRSISKAGRLVTQNVSEILGIPYERAESIKHQGINGENNGAIIEAVQPVISEVKNTIKFFEHEIKGEIKTIIISGGGSQMPGLGNYLSEELGKEIKKLFIPELGVNDSPIFAGSFALALYGSSLKRGMVNLREGKYKYVGTDDELRRKFLLPAIIFLLIIMLSLYGAGSRYFQLKGIVKEKEDQIQARVKDVFPNVRVIPKPLTYLKSEVKKAAERLELLEGIVGRQTPLDVLKDISSSIPSNMALTVNEISFEGNNMVRMRGISRSYEEVAKIEETLSDSGKFDEVNRDKTSSSVNNTIKYEISMVLK